MIVAGWHGRLASSKKIGSEERSQTQQPVYHGHADPFSPASLGPPIQRCDGAECGVQASHKVTNGGARPHRTALQGPVATHEPTHRLRNEIERRPVRIGPTFPESGDAGMDD